MHIQSLLEIPPYALTQAEKEKQLLPLLKELTEQHRENCESYRRMIEVFYPVTDANSLSEIPYLPINVFKELELFSIPSDSIFKKMHSSGTTGDRPSTIILDAETAHLQTFALANIMKEYLGNTRLPMLIIDSQSVIKNPKEFSARAAGIIGLSHFGRDHFYALDDTMQLREKELIEWLDKHKGSELFAFGFTYIIWKHLVDLQKQPNLNLAKTLLFHSGGWKKLEAEKVDPALFNTLLLDKYQIQKSHNFYGLVEQVGNIFVECEHQLLHCPNTAEIIIRNSKTWEPAPTGQPGVIQLLSPLPKSYPGHSLLTEDLGVIETIDQCPCGRKGKGFKVLGRVPKAEPRGCGDTYAVT